MIRHPVKFEEKKIGVGSPTTSAVVSGGTTISFSHTVESNSNMALFVFVVFLSIANTVDSITYNGVGLSLANAQQVNGGGDGDVEVWYLANPTLGANTVLVTSNLTMGGAAPGQAVAVALSNVNVLVADTGASASLGSGTSTFADIVPANPHAMLLNTILRDLDEDTTIGTGETSIIDLAMTDGDNGQLSVSYRDAGPTISSQRCTGSWTTSRDFAQILLAIRRG